MGDEEFIVTTADMLEIVAGGGNGVEFVNIPALLEQAAKELREKDEEIAEWEEAHKGRCKDWLYWKDQDARLREENARLREAQSNLDEFSRHKNWSLNYKSPIYGDDDDQEKCWVVYKETGPINDREWEAIGKGETAAEAIAAAIAKARGETGENEGYAKTTF